MKWVLLVGGLAVSAALTAVLWMLGLPGFFLLLPFVFAPFLFGASKPAKRCPACGRAATDPDDAYCPRDGTPLARQ